MKAVNGKCDKILRDPGRQSRHRRIDKRRKAERHFRNRHRQRRR